MFLWGKITCETLLFYFEPLKKKSISDINLNKHILKDKSSAYNKHRMFKTNFQKEVNVKTPKKLIRTVFQFHKMMADKFVKF